MIIRRVPPSELLNTDERSNTSQRLATAAFEKKKKKLRKVTIWQEEKLKTNMRVEMFLQPSMTVSTAGANC